MALRQFVRNAGGLLTRESVAVRCMSTMKVNQVTGAPMELFERKVSKNDVDVFLPRVAGGGGVGAHPRPPKKIKIKNQDKLSPSLPPLAPSVRG